jgi:hypothetical protein
MSGEAYWEFTGNHDLSIPLISPSDGGIHHISVLHRGANGNLAWNGAAAHGEVPLLAPEVREGGELLPLGAPAWERLDRWIPRFRTDLGQGLILTGTICAPGGADLSVPGGVYLLELENHGHSERELDLGLAGQWRRSSRSILSTRSLTTSNRVIRAMDGVGLALELGGEPALAALGLLADRPDATYLVGGAGEEPRELPNGTDHETAPGAAISLRISRRIRLAPGRRASFALYLAVAPERDGALARATELRRRGAPELIRLARLALAQLARRSPDPVTGALLNRNLLFNVFYAVARAVDDERLYPVVSRSPLAGQGPVFRERDALLWSLPALRLADANLAREILLRTFEQFSHHPGALLHYVDGTILSASFALDQFCAYAIALDEYVRETRDETILDEPIVVDVLRELDGLIAGHLHPEIFLGATEVLPSGEAPAQPYVTYDNVLLWACCAALGRLLAAEGEAPLHGAAAAEEVAAAIWRYCVAEVEGLRILACSTDLQGEAAIYDDPEGSLLTLLHLGFCEADDPVWRNTVEFLHSDAYPFWLGGREYPGTGMREVPELASLAGLCAALLGPRRDEALATLRRLRLVGGVASRWYDPDTGASGGGSHHAAAAGLLAWTLSRAVSG